MTFASKNIVSEYEEHQELHRKQAHNQDKSDYFSVALQKFCWQTTHIFCESTTIVLLVLLFYVV